MATGGTREASQSGAPVAPIVAQLFLWSQNTSSRQPSDDLVKLANSVTLAAKNFMIRVRLALEWLAVQEVCHGTQTPAVVRSEIFSRHGWRGPQQRVPQGPDRLITGRPRGCGLLLKVTVVSEQGKEAVVAMLGTNQFFGEGCLAGQAQRIVTVATVTDSVIVRLEKAAIVRVIQHESAFSEMFIAHLLARAIRVEADLVDQLFNSSEKRLARMLLLLANFGKDEKPEPILAKISQGTLA